MEASLALDAIPGFIASDIERALVRIVPDPEGTVVALEDGRVVGYCTPHHDDLTVDPGVPPARPRPAAGPGRPRRRPATRSRRPSPAVRPAAPAGLGGLRRGDGPALPLEPVAVRAARPAQAVPPPAFPADVVVRAFDPARDADLDAWLRFMLATFEGHPTQMTWTPAVIAHIHAAPDFDPSAILRVVRGGDGRARRVRADPGRRTRAGRQRPARSGWSACCRPGAAAASGASCCAGA